jgi:hypothetical protein
MRSVGRAVTLALILASSNLALAQSDVADAAMQRDTFQNYIRREDIRRGEWTVFYP